MGIFSTKHSGSLTWESIESKGEGNKPNYCARTKVFGGWLVSSQVELSGRFIFLPDPNHEWELDPIEK